MLLKVPVGTVVLEKDQDNEVFMIGDLEQPGRSLVIVKGGKAGLGNIHFASSTNQVPRIAEKGERGEEKSFHLELRLIADVGIIGYPNVGKSTLLDAVSAAHPRIAGFPFTTKEPVVGVVEVGLVRFVLAEIPGLIDGAHLGRGLGHDFLRHATRTRMFIHVVDGSSATPVEDMIRVNTELGLFDAALARKPQILVVNKVDLPGVVTRFAEIETAFAGVGAEPMPVSAATGTGTVELMERVREMLEHTADTGIEVPLKVFRPQPRRDRTTVTKEGDVFVVWAPRLERIVARTGTEDTEVRRQLNRQLARLGVDRALERAGATRGDRVRCGQLEWEW